VAVAVRLPFALAGPPPRSSGWMENEAVAISLTEGQGFANAFGSGTGPTAHCSPAYPWMLAALYGVFGLPWTYAGALAQAMLSIALEVSFIALTPPLARRLNFSPRVGWLAAFLLACDVRMWEVKIRGTYDQMLGALLLGGLVLSLDALKRGGWTGTRRILGTGLLLGFTALSAPFLLAIPAFFLAVELAGRLPGGGEAAYRRWQIVRAAGILSVLSAVLLCPWIVRNFLVFGQLVPLRSNLGLELAVGNRPGSTGWTNSPGLFEIHPWSSARERADLIRMGEPAYMKHRGAQARAWIDEHPIPFVVLTIRRAVLFLIGSSWPWYDIPVTAPSFFALVALCFRRHPSQRWLLCIVLGGMLPYLFTHCEPRYRLPISSVTALLNAVFLLACSSWLASPGRRLQADLRVHDPAHHDFELPGGLAGGELRPAA
jgi:hypothetical protein